MAKHVCRNLYHGDGARGGCYVMAEPGDKPETISLDVGWSCVVVHRDTIPVTWLAELVAIATAHEGGIAGFLKAHDYGSPSYALMCDPAK